MEAFFERQKYNFSQCSINATMCNGTSCLMPEDNFNQILNSILSIVLTVLLALVMFSMGCNAEVRNLWEHIKRPWGICVGILCQFGIMPLTAFLLSLAFGIHPLQAVAVLIMGCCPGGTGSNIISYWLDGDMDLSISMTTFSTLLALGMMPLCLYIYTKMWVGTDVIQIPYDSIGITLATILIPVVVGIFVNHKWPKQAKIILKIGSIAGAILIVIIGVAGGLLYKGSWAADPRLWIIGAIFPVVGFCFGFILARIAGQPAWRSRTVCIETGFQNTQLCTTIVQLSFTQEQLSLMFIFPLIYTVFQLVFAAILVLSYQIYKRCWSKEEDEDLREKGNSDEQPDLPYAITNGKYTPQENAYQNVSASTHL